MKLLLLHPEDVPTHGPWTQHSWDQVVDLGKAGRSTYDQWNDFFHCPVETLQKLDLDDFGQIRRALSSGLGALEDEYGLDWWELISIRFHEQIERILSLQKLAVQIGSKDEIFLTRSGFYARVLEFLLGCKVHSFLPANSASRRLRRAASVASKFSFRQLLQILGDKYDAGYRIRHFVARREGRSGRPVVLLPSAYVNASRTALSYASTLPDRDFLLVATRESGWIGHPPKNVSVARLASYAPGKYRKHEYRQLLERWRELQVHLDRDRELSILKRLGDFESVPALLREGLAIRDGWLQVFESEPVASVLCADDSNPYTHLPLLIARKRGLPAIACHHGALDGRYLVKKSHADLILAKGRMERDYLVKTCGVAEERVEIAAPPENEAPTASQTRERRSLVFFSEPYEIGGGRCAEFYREVLPRLADIARAMGRELVIKLHPQESLRERRRFVNAALSPIQRKRTRIVEGLLNEQLLRQTYLALTVLSTTAVDCTLRGIPVFLCTWLDGSNYGYVEHFIRFGAGARLSSADKILEIPRLIERFLSQSTGDLWDPVKPDRLEQLLCESAKLAAAV
jgi:hypothetical protein